MISFRRAPAQPVERALLLQSTTRESVERRPDALRRLT
jgi:hypothetical protein